MGRKKKPIAIPSNEAERLQSSCYKLGRSSSSNPIDFLMYLCIFLIVWFGQCTLYITVAWEDINFDRTLFVLGGCFILTVSAFFLANKICNLSLLIYEVSRLRMVTVEKPRLQKAYQDFFEVLTTSDDRCIKRGAVMLMKWL